MTLGEADDLVCEFAFLSHPGPPSSTSAKVPCESARGHRSVSRQVAASRPILTSAFGSPLTVTGLPIQDRRLKCGLAIYRESRIVGGENHRLPSPLRQTKFPELPRLEKRFGDLASIQMGR